ncbi:MAG TPA: DUF4157 domain-containing protein [Micromonosporaceae bacterium]|nr:DUF4157 domain-containing protein [Micromonosporaceae bacterium]
MHRPAPRISAPSDPAERAAQALAGRVAPDQHSGHTRQEAQDRWSGRPAPPAVLDVLATPGRPLPEATRGHFAPRLGHDLRRVRIHTDDRAARSAAMVGADAYTVGRHIVFAPGRFAPHDARGARLLAHELAHVATSPGPGHLLRQQAGPEWFGGPRTPAARGLADQETADYSIRNNIVVEKAPKYSIVGIAVGTATANVAIRYAFPASEISSASGQYTWGESATITRAKKEVNDALAKVVANFQNYPTTPGSRTNQVRERRLTQMLTQFTTQRPLNIFISVNPMDMSPISSAVTINAATASRDAATLIPAQMFSAARLAPSGTPTGAATTQETQTTMLHEVTHDALTRAKADFPAVWNANNMALVPVPSGPLANLLLDLARAFVVAQEEDFAYTVEESLPPAGSPAATGPGPQHRSYQSFVATARGFFTKKGLTFKAVTQRVIPTSTDRDVTGWTISYQFPIGTVNLTSGDEATINLLLGSFAMTHGGARAAILRPGKP